MLQSKTCIGIDVSGRDVKIVELRKSRGRYEVVQAVKLKPGDWDIATVLKQYLLETDTSPDVVAVSLPTHLCSVKFATLPKSSETETARMARFEAETRIPVPLADLAWGFSASRPAQGESLRGVILAGARRADVDGMLSLVEPSGLTVSSITVASMASAKCLSTSQTREEPVLAIDVGPEWTHLTIMSQGRVTASHSINLGLDGLAVALAEDRGVEIGEAKDLILKQSVLQMVQGIGTGKDDASMVEQWVGSIALEARRAALTGNAMPGTPLLSSALLIGQGAYIPDLKEAIAGKTGLAVETGDPWSGMVLSAVAAHNASEESALFAVATGLAMAGFDNRDLINLLPAERTAEHLQERRQVIVLGSLGLAVLILFGLLLAGRSELRAKQADSRRLQGLIASARKESAGSKVGPMPAAGSIEKVVDGLQSRNAGSLNILRQVSTSLSKSCWLSELRFEAGKSVVLRGSALSNSAVADTVYQLTGTKAFESVSLDYSNLSQSGNTTVYEFQVKCALPAKPSASKPSGKGKSVKAGLVIR